MVRYFQYILLFSLSFVCFSCTKPVYYELYQTIDSPWDKDKAYFFTCEIEDITVSYNISIHIRNNKLYPYQNLWLLYKEVQPEGIVVRDTIACVLTDDYGKWLGSGISVYHLTIPIRHQYTFPRTGQYIFTIQQGMRDSKLKGIENIGLRIEKSVTQ